MFKKNIQALCHNRKTDSMTVWYKTLNFYYLTPITINKS